MNTQELKAHNPIEDVAREWYRINFDPKGWGHCPFSEKHNNGDADPSLHLDRRHQRVRCESQNCFNGAANVIDLVMKMEGVVFKEAAKKLAQRAGLNGHTRPTVGQGRRLVAVYDYRDEQGNLLFQVLRYEPGHDGRSKDFDVRRPDGEGGWIDNAKGVRRVPYRLPELLSSGGPVVIGAGEKCVDVFYNLGFTATTNPFGEDHWPEDFSAFLKDRDVIVWRDKDEKGRSYAEAVSRSMRSVARSIRMVEPPAELPEKGDVADGVEELGWSSDDVLRILEGAQPWEPAKTNLPEAKRQEGMAQPQTPLVESPQAKRPVFPLDLPATVWRGIVADYRDMLARTTEASDAFHLFTFLPYAGFLIGRRAFLRYGLALYGNLYACIVGPTYEGRKTTSTRHAERTLKEVDPSLRVLRGISSAEGLLSQVADPWQKANQKGQVVGEGGTKDKRLLVSLGELSTLLKKAKQEGVANIIPILTEAFDCPPDLHLPTRHDPIVVTEPYVSLLATSTPSWLEDLQDRDVLGGFANRFLYILGESKAPIPFPDPPDTDLRRKIIAHLKEVLAWLPEVPEEVEVSLDASARDLWADFYTRWRKLAWGDELFAALVQRIPDITLKIALIYAVLEKRTEVDADILTAAIDAGGYAVSSAQRIFTDFHATRESKLEKRILEVLGAIPVKFGDLHRAVSGRYSTLDLNRALDALMRSGQVWRQEQGGTVSFGRVEEK